MDPAGVEGMKVVLVSNRTLRGQCLARFLERVGLGITIIAQENIREKLLPKIDSVGLAIIDTGEHTCRDPEFRSSFACLRDALANVPIVVVSDREDWPALVDALNLGARAYFPSSLHPDILIETLRFVQKGGTFFPLEVLVNAPAHRRRPQGAEKRRTELPGLTPTEQRVSELLRTGQPNKVHVRRIMRKVNAANRTQVALAAQQIGFFNGLDLQQDLKVLERV
jgi:DNA-binding NarL/FixJ family response regulator